MNSEIQEKQSKIEYVQTCANYLLSKTVDARGLTINMNELTKFCQQLRDLTKRIAKLKQNLIFYKTFNNYFITINLHNNSTYLPPFVPQNTLRTLRPYPPPHRPMFFLQSS